MAKLVLYLPLVFAASSVAASYDINKHRTILSRDPTRILQARAISIPSPIISTSPKATRSEETALLLQKRGQCIGKTCKKHDSSQPSPRTPTPWPLMDQPQSASQRGSGSPQTPLRAGRLPNTERSPPSDNRSQRSRLFPDLSPASSIGETASPPSSWVRSSSASQRARGSPASPGATSITPKSGVSPPSLESGQSPNTKGTSSTNETPQGSLSPVLRKIDSYSDIRQSGLSRRAVHLLLDDDIDLPSTYRKRSILPRGSCMGKGCGGRSSGGGRRRDSVSPPVDVTDRSTTSTQRAEAGSSPRDSSPRRTPVGPSPSLRRTSMSPAMSSGSQDPKTSKSGLSRPASAETIDSSRPRRLPSGAVSVSPIPRSARRLSGAGSQSSPGSMTTSSGPQGSPSDGVSTPPSSRIGAHYGPQDRASPDSVSPPSSRIEASYGTQGRGASEKKLSPAPSIGQGSAHGTSIDTTRGSEAPRRYDSIDRLYDTK